MSKQLKLNLNKGKWGGRRSGCGRKRIHSQGVAHRPHGLRVIHFSLQSNHVHLIIEPETNETLTRGMRSLTITFAKGLKKGKVQMERYHLHVLKSLRETRNAVLYVLFNQQRHEKGRCSQIDEYSSLPYLRDALKLIKEFAVKEKMTLKITKCDAWPMDKGQSYLLRNFIQ